MIIEGNLIDIHQRRIYPAIITVVDDRIVDITETDGVYKYYISPGFVDAHVHIESSMLTPSRFAEVVIPFGTVATVSDPHEIANVCGVEGIEFMINNARKVPLKIYFGAPSCVPATNFETSGSVINTDDIGRLFERENLKYLSEMMNFPGVIYDDAEVLKKIEIAQKFNRKIDGHAPGLRGKKLKKYCDSGISTDHESYSLDEALEKIEYGMKIQIREGSAAKNYQALKSLLKTHPGKVMFCTDDAHPDDLLRHGHINNIVKRAINEGFNLYDVLRAAGHTAIEHYGLDVGQLKKHDKADFIIIEDLTKFNIKEVYINGIEVFKNQTITFKGDQIETINNFNCDFISTSELEVKDINKKIRVIKVIDGEIITESGIITPKVYDGLVVPDVERDILKVVVYNRYKKSKPAVGFITNFNLKSGALASSIAHDSHNIVAVGTNDLDISNAINILVKNKGGISFSDHNNNDVLPLPVAGLMSTNNGKEVAKKYEQLTMIVKESGCSLTSPFMTLSFVPLLVIPSLKIGDKGLFDVNKFSFVPLEVDEE